MRILGALDENSYSFNILKDLALLCSNTWADITLLVLSDKKELKEPEKLLKEYVQNFYQFAGEKEGPYKIPKDFKLTKTTNGELIFRTKGIKEFVLKLIFAKDPSKEILKQAKELEADLIVLGCSKGMDCQWKGIVGLPHKVARDANCSVLIIKESTAPKQIISFLDQSNVSQESLELINQMVTIHDAGLKIVGLMGEKGVVGKDNVEKKMLEILYYYNEKGMKAWITFIDKNEIEEYIARATGEGMVALWMGKKSFFSKIFSTNLLIKLIEHAKSSVLILR